MVSLLEQCLTFPASDTGSQSAPQTPHCLLVGGNPCEPTLSVWMCQKPHLPQQSPSQEQPLQENTARGHFEVMSFLLFQGAIYRGTCCQEIDGQKGWISCCIARGESLDPSRSVAKFPLTSMRAGIPPCSALLDAFTWKPRVTARC